MHRFHPIVSRKAMSLGITRGGATPASVVGGNVSPARVDAATELRKLGHLLIAREVDDEQLAAIARWATRQALSLQPRTVRRMASQTP